MTLKDLEKLNPEKAKAITNLDVSVKNEVSENLKEYFHQVNRFFQDTLESFKDNIKAVFEPLRMVISKNLMEPGDDRTDNIREVLEDFKNNLVGIFKGGKPATNFRDIRSESSSKELPVKKAKKTKLITEVEKIIKRLDAAERSGLIEHKGGKVRSAAEDFFANLIEKPELFKVSREEREKKQSFIAIEKDLRKEEFEGVSERKIERILTEEYENIKRIRDIEEELNKLRKSGYTEKEITKSTVYQEQQTLMEAFDNSLAKTLPTEEERHEEQHLLSLELEEQQEQTTLLEKIFDLLHKQSKPKGGILSGEFDAGSDSVPGTSAGKTGVIAATAAAAGAGLGAVASKAKGLLGKSGKFLGRVGGPLVGLGFAAHEYHEKHTEIETLKTEKLHELDMALESGQITPDEYNLAREDIEKEARNQKIEEGGATGGRIAGGLAGMKAGGFAGAKAGMLLGPKGAAAGAVIGGIIGGGIGFMKGDKPGRWLASKFTGRDKQLENVDEQQRAVEAVREKEIPAAIMTMEEHDSTSSLADEIGKKIVVNVPQPVVIDRSPNVVSSPFSDKIRNDEPSINEFIKSRY